MTQEARTTESGNRDNAAIREIMHQIKDLTVPDRATLALGLIGHLATLMNGRQMEKLLAQLVEEAAKVQDVPPMRSGSGSGSGSASPSPSPSGEGAGKKGAGLEGGAGAGGAGAGDGGGSGSVGQAGRGAVSEDSSGLL